MNISAVTEASPAIQIHLAAAMVALVLGCLMWARKKGTRSHKMIGRAFVLCMLLAAFSAIFIRTINDGSFSLIHLFVPITFIGSWQVVSSIRAGKIKSHKKHVRNLFFFALLIPGAFAFMPGRTMWMLFFG
jgi:uncharacterized membrane protein